MTDLPTLTSLLERVEKASGPNLALEVDIARALGTAPADLSFVEETQSWQRYIVARDDVQIWMPPPYTASLDSALALVNEMLPGWFWRAGHVPSTHWVNGIAYHCWCHLSRTHADHCERDDEATGWAHTVPTAMLSALLRALIAQKETTDGK